MTTETIKARFAPSPTGKMHVGNVRTALFNLLFALHHHGAFLLRMEDTDRVRSEQQYSDGLIRDLKWLGCEWQEGPYWQSERQEIYDGYYEQLLKEGLAYYCFCSEEQLALNRKIQRAAGKPPRYPGTCCDLTQAEIEHKIAAGEKPVLRFKVPENHTIAFTDLVKGEQSFNSKDIGDFIIRRGDGTSPFMFCSVIDDALMGVTYVLRGEDHLTNTPRQLMILRALGLAEPKYGHISLIMGSDGAPLSKRNGSRSIDELRQEGFLASAIINYLARLGHNYASNNLLSLAELATEFKESSLSHSPARFEAQQLLHWQKEVLATINDEGFYGWLNDDTRRIIPLEKVAEFIKAVRHNVIFPADANKWAEIFFTELEYSEAAKAVIKDRGRHYFEVAVELISQYGADYAKIVKTLQEKLSISGKGLYLPLRIALTGESHGPELAAIFAILGAGKIEKRLKNAGNI